MGFKKSKEFVGKHFESILVVFLLLGLTFILLFVSQKMGFLNFYYLPVLVAGSALGKRGGVLTALSSILIVIFSILVFPAQYLKSGGTEMLNIVLNLLAWGGFLIIASYTVGYLQEQKQAQVNIIHEAYIGVLEILSKLVESVDRYTEGHSVRVSRLSTDIAIAMDLSRDQVENIRVAGLLHDIGKFEVTTGLIQKAASLTDHEREEMSKHTEMGARLVSQVGPVLKEAVPIILAHHQFYMTESKSPHGEIPLGARIIAVADSYDAIVTDRPYRKGRPHWQAVNEIRSAIGTQFDPVVVEAFERVSANYALAEK